jgi:hypothetical protein
MIREAPSCVSRARARKKVAQDPDQSLRGKGNPQVWERCITSCIKHRHPMLCSVTDRSAKEGVVETFL